MKASRVLALAWVAGVSTASRCKPSSPYSSASSSISSSSMSSSVSSSVPLSASSSVSSSVSSSIPSSASSSSVFSSVSSSISSSSVSSLVSSSVSSSASSSVSSSASSSASSSVSSSISSSASPSPSPACGVNLLGNDINIVSDASGDWDLQASTPSLIYAETCGQSPSNDCIGMYFTGQTPAAYSGSFAYTATTVPGDAYTFSFSGTSDYPGVTGILTCTASDSVGTATTNYDLSTMVVGIWVPASLDFTATGTEAVITCSLDTEVDSALAIGFSIFSLVRDC